MCWSLRLIKTFEVQASCNYADKYFVKIGTFEMADSANNSRAEAYLELCRSSHHRWSIKIGVATLLKKKLWHRCFPVNFAKILRTHFRKNSSGRLGRQ